MIPGNNSRRRFLAASLGATSLGIASTIPILPALARTPDGVLTATDVHVDGYPTVEAVKWIGETLERETDGRLRIRLYHSGQLGRESEAIDMARFGAIDITRVYTGALNNAFPLTQALCLPYVFDSVEHMRRVCDGEVGDTVLRGFESRDLVGLAIYDSGARCFYNTQRPLVTPQDMRGLKFRVPASDIFIQLLKLFGANPTPLGYGAVFSSLETRLIDGAENNMRSFHSSRHFEVARHWSQSEHSYAPDVLLISRRSLEALSPSDRALVMDVARSSVAVMRKLWDASEIEARKAVAESGVSFNEVDMQAFEAAARPLLDDYLNRERIAPLYRLIREQAARDRA
ncbi:TRAP transporter substrate-binding protein [Marilutibacter alkalisoli]|uniref:TRAP transporter substrate-binding protein n=1 Tax=Marilutibacter alkalisoli TaxID=2591633 RepID=A0A514BNJ2_9GAMM|nr:TRAP transporter substrate-binding protein [Lysobacter alkalisoli]QDH68895.1 TRAP transporter substrate-binding protein [Lysobacter alkalisoli]